MTKVECLKGILAKMKGVQASAIQGNTVCDVLHQMADNVSYSKFVVNVTSSVVEGTTVYTADKTLAQIYAAHQAGKIIECHYSAFALHPLMISSSVCSFSCEVMSTSAVAERTTINITADTVGVTTLRHTLTPAV